MISDEQTLQVLKNWVETESPSRHAAGVNAMADLVAASVADSPVSVERIDGRDGLGDMLVLRTGPETTRPPLLVLSHLDTVHPLGTVGSALPFRQEGDRLYGPGVYDMKGGLHIGIEALKSVARQRSANGPIVYLCTPDEEIGSPTSRSAIERFGRAARAALVTEPARDGGKIVTARKGACRFEVTVEGRAAHAGTHHADGRNAIYEAARQILAIEAITDRSRGLTTTVGMIAGGTAANTIPQSCSFPVDARFETVEDGDRVARGVLGLSPTSADFRMVVSGGVDRPAYDCGPAGQALFDIAARLAGEVGFKLEACGRTGGGSDGNFTAALGVATLDGLGVDGDGAHTLEEHALISSLRPRWQLLTRLFETV